MSSSSSYRGGAPVSRRSAGSSLLGLRPRSLGLYGNSPAASYLSGSSPARTSSYLSSGPKNSYLSSASPRSLSYLSTYGGTTSGYGGFTLKSMAPYSKSSALLPTRSSSFNLHRASKNSTPLSSRSGSWASLAASSRSGSEGYASGGDWPSHSSRLSSPPADDDSLPATRSTKDASENGEIDYKKLYEASMVENERLREKLKKTEGDLIEAKSQDKIPATPTKNSLSEMEKRERRAMERKLSEMEEELKQLQKLKAENERLKAENRALTRVVSKLTNSANATK